MFDKLFQEIAGTVTLNSEDKDLCTRFFESVSVGRNTILEEQDKVSQFLYFVSEGFLRLFYYDDNGDEITTFLASPNGFIASFLSLIHQKPGNGKCRMYHGLQTAKNFKTKSYSAY